MSYYFIQLFLFFMTDREALVAPLLLNYDHDPEEGVIAFCRAIEAQVAGVSDHPDVLMVFGLHLLAVKRWEEAEATLRKALETTKKKFLVLYNLGFLLFQQKRLQEAEPIFWQVLELESNHVDAMMMLANVLKGLMRRDEALAPIRRAQAVEPSNHVPVAFDRFETVYDPSSTDASIFAKVQRVVELRCGAHQTKTKLPMRQVVGPLRIGFVSGDFKMHPVGHFLHGWLPYVDRSRCLLHAFSMWHEDDVMTQQLRSQFETWDDIRALTDDELLSLVAKRQMDVLIDLSGHTDMNRLPVFARRAAPVQISYLGWYATSGVVNMDYFLTDPISSPAASQAHYSEQLLYLPKTRLCFSVPSFVPEVGALPTLQNAHITFGSFQSLEKITDRTLDLWRQVLWQVPSARLVICCQQFVQQGVRDLLRQRLALAELLVDRVQLLPPASYSKYFQLYRNIDVVLDTTPFPGGTTTAEALWMGVPTLTLLGSTLIARQGASLMSAAGLADWVSNSEGEYIAKAIYWSEHLDELAALRARLREQVRASSLFDSPRFAQAFTEAIESAYNAKLLLQPLRDI
jgi:predicted O-linked N-acetylglucosamine transferase (SPINDLY family)